MKKILLIGALAAGLFHNAVASDLDLDLGLESHLSLPSSVAHEASTDLPVEQTTEQGSVSQGMVAEEEEGTRESNWVIKKKDSHYQLLNSDSGEKILFSDMSELKQHFLEENVTRLTLLGAPEVLQLLPESLDHLKISGFLSFSNTFLASIPRNLLSLDLKGCGYFTKPGVSLTHLPTSLLALNLSFCYFTDKDLKDLPTSLTSLDLSRTDVTDAGLKDLPTNLTSLNLSRTKITDEGIKHLPPSLLSLNLSRTKITDTGLKDLSTSLTSLNLSMTNVTDAGLKDLSTSLTDLNLSGCRPLTVPELSLFSCLTSLNLSRTKITDTGLKDLSTSLTDLNLSGCHYLTAPDLSPLSRLTFLDLSKCYRFTGEGLGHLSSSLTSLKLSWRKNLTYEDRKSLFQRLPHLECLDLSICWDLANIDLMLLSLSSLTYLNLKGCNRITDSGLGALSQNTALTSLDLSYCSGINESARLESLPSSLKFLFLEQSEVSLSTVVALEKKGIQVTHSPVSYECY